MKLRFRKKGIIYILIILILGFSINIDKKQNKKQGIIMGGSYLERVCEEIDMKVENSDSGYDLEKYFRPSNLPILNTKPYTLFEETYGKKTSDIKLPNELFTKPKDTIINYFSVLREAANPTSKNRTGCGTLGYAKEPYPVAYNFLSSDYQNKITYNQYLKSFENMLHINLIKLKQVQTDKEHPDSLKYFVEIEVIEGSDEPKGYFSYYYGFIYLDKGNNLYKISDIKYYSENYLCAPYHGWSYNAEYIIDIEYGEWCSLVKEKIKTETYGYEKRIYFMGNDGYEYYVLFFELTNGTEIKISDYRKDENGVWREVDIDTKKCLKK